MCDPTHRIQVSASSGFFPAKMVIAVMNCDRRSRTRFSGTSVVNEIIEFGY